MKKLRVAIIGCGRISQSYSEAFKKLLSEIEVLAAIDIDLNRAKSFASDFPGCQVFSSLEETKGLKIDVLHIALPHYLHSPYAVKALKMGMNVLTEKPMSIDLEDGRKMIEEAKRDNLLLGCIFQTRFNESVTILKKMKDEGEFGKITKVESTLNWHRDEAYFLASSWKGKWDSEGGGVLIDQAIHSLDRVLYIMGEKVLSAKGRIANVAHPYIEVEDEVEAFLRFESGIIYHLKANDHNEKDDPIHITFYGEKGSFGLIQDMGWSLINGERKEYKEVEPGESVLPSYWGTTHIMELRDFYKAVRKEGAMLVDGAEGLKTLEAVKGIYLSSILGQELNFPFIDASIAPLDLRVSSSMALARNRLMEKCGFMAYNKKK